MAKRRVFIVNTQLNSGSLSGWIISIVVHLAAAGVFFAVAANGRGVTRPAKCVPTSSIAPVAEQLNVESLVEDLQLLPLLGDQLLPNQSAMTAMPDAGVVPPIGDAITAITAGSDGIAYAGANVLSDTNHTRFCGTTGRANRVCYVVDCSGSMVMAFDYVCCELRRAISRLSPGQYFDVIFFAHGEPVEMNKTRLIRANSENRQMAMVFVDNQELISVASEEAAWKGVVAALERAFEARSSGGGVVELIYLLTDGEFNHQKVAEFVRQSQLTRQRAAVINVIACGSRDSQVFLRSLANAYGGTYRFVSDEELVQEGSSLSPVGLSTGGASK